MLDNLSDHALKNKTTGQHTAHRKVDPQKYNMLSTRNSLFVMPIFGLSGVTDLSKFNYVSRLHNSIQLGALKAEKES